MLKRFYLKVLTLHYLTSVLQVLSFEYKAYKAIT